MLRNYKAQGLIIVLFFLCLFSSQIISNPHKPIIQKYIERLRAEYSYNRKDKLIIIDASEQELLVIKNNKIIKKYLVSTAQNGLGSKVDSNKTPLGIHKICKKIGRGAKTGAIFKYRKETNKIAKNLLDNAKNDLITSRILVLKGLEPGLNQGRGIDSLKRRIYIHGTAEEAKIGKPVSKGCIRMKNQDIIKLFQKVKVGTLVIISKKLSLTNSSSPKIYR